MQELPIHPLLTDIIGRACVAQHERPENYTVLPSIYTVIGFQFSGRIHHAGENRPLDTFGVTGILDTWRPFRSEAATGSLLIFFKPGGFYRLFGSVAAALKSDSLALADVISPNGRKILTDILSNAAHISEKWRLLQKQFLRLVDRELSPESQGALYYLQAENGLPRIESVAKNLGVSRRTLERKFRAEIGTPPKHLARILRWHKAIRNLSRYADLATAALANGYFDQAHFVRETQSLSGISPKKLKSPAF